MALSKSFEKYLKKIVREAVTSTHRTAHEGDKASESDDTSPPVDDDARFWKIKETPEKEDDDEIYCSKFDDMADVHIEELTDGLNAQLDNLLLFAALFSGINSAFIVFSLPNLVNPFQGMELLIDVLIGSGNNATAAQMAQKILDSQNPSTTLNVSVNVLFASSLICSLITAFFAVVGKQWLSYVAEDPSHGDERARRWKMQKKIIGIQRYRLRALLDAVLTTTVQISLFLFMLGLILFLYTFNNIVTLFVVAFAGAGMLAYVVSAAYALHDPACPFQTPVTRTLLPGLLSASFHSMYAFWALVRWARITLLTKPDSESNKQEAYSTTLPGGWNDSPGSEDPFEIQWDRRHKLRQNLAAKLRSKPKDEHVSIKAACWMIQRADHEMEARVAALALLDVTKREDLNFVASYNETTRRLRDVISVNDEVLKQKADDPSDIKEREWKKLCFYVQVLSHIFAGQTALDTAQSQVMDWIYQYQKNRNPVRSKHAYTCAPARMVGVIKLLLLHYDEKHYSMKHEREKTLRRRLYEAPSEPECSTKALSLAAFAMKTLPRAQSNEDQEDKDRLREELWDSYIKNDPGILLKNFVGAVDTYADLIYPETNLSPATTFTLNAAREILPSARQLQRLWQGIAKKALAKPDLPIGKALVEVTDEVQPEQEEESRTADSNDSTGREPEGTASLAEACFNLAKACSTKTTAFAAYGKDDKFWKNAPNEEIDAARQIVYDLWKLCHGDALRYASGEPPSSSVDIVQHLLTATALLRVVDLKLTGSRLESITNKRQSLDDGGLKWIRLLVAKLKVEELGRDLFFTSEKARGAISYFLLRLAEVDPQGSLTELDFAEKYVSHCQEKGLGEFQPMKRLAEVVTKWKDTPTPRPGIIRRFSTAISGILPPPQSDID